MIINREKVLKISNVHFNVFEVFCLKKLVRHYKRKLGDRGYIYYDWSSMLEVLNKIWEGDLTVKFKMTNF